MKGHVFTVGEVNQYIKSAMETDTTLASIYVRGEISNYKFHSSGHHYMTLKDEIGVLRAVMFKFDAHRLKFRPESGMKVIAKGRISVFPRDGQYQLYISDMIPDGVGALYVAFEQLKKKLMEEGLFDSAYKKPIPAYPSSIALVTSPTGAAVRDMLRILKARYPLASVMIYPVLVQGADAPANIANALNTLNDNNACDLIITGRGGGSLEDLWAFNDEMVARAIFSSKIPVISAVGHEPDVTIADFVADLRAATPSNAAELAVPDTVHLKNKLRDMEIRATQSVANKLNIYREYLKKAAEKPVMQSPLNYFQEKRLMLDFTVGKLCAAMQRILSVDREKFVHLAAKLDAMSPLKVLSRGYSIAMDEDDHVVKNVSSLQRGDRIKIELHDGNIGCIIDEIRKKGG